jgi:GNAT superfamily N-acetyltransferase
MSSAPVVYVIDSSGRLGRALEALLSHYAIRVTVISDMAEYLELAASEEPVSTCLIYVLASDCEAGVPDISRVHAAHPGLPVIVLCNAPSDALRQRYIDAGAIDMVSKSMVDAYTYTRLSDLLPDVKDLPRTRSAVMRSRNGTDITIRMLNPDDSEIERQFVVDLSDQSRYLRFFSGMKKLPDYVLKQLLDIHFPVSYALIATVPTDTGEKQIGVARYAPTQHSDVAEFAVVVADEWQGQGVASELLRGVFTAATMAGINRLEGLVLRENTPMLRLAKKMGFSVSNDSGPDKSLLKVFKDLRHSSPPPQREGSATD